MGKSMSVARTNSSVRNVVKKTDTITPNVIEPNRNSVRPKVYPDRIANPSQDYLNRVNEIDRGFNDRLKNVFVTSTNKNYEPTSQPSDILATQATNKLTLNDVREILVIHIKNKGNFSAENIAAEYNTDAATIEKIVQNFCAFDVFLQQDSIADSASRKSMRGRELPYDPRIDNRVVPSMHPDEILPMIDADLRRKQAQDEKKQKEEIEKLEKEQKKVE